MRAAILLLILVGPCRADGLGAGWTGPDGTWWLVEMHGAPFDAAASLRFAEGGRIEGDAPCNAYDAELDAGPPAFAIGPVRSTRRGCRDLDAEAAFLAALEASVAADVSGTTLVLTDADGRTLVFSRD